MTREVHRSSLRRLICPAQDHFICLTVLIISMTFVFSLTQMLVFLSLYVMLRILLSILVLFGQCPGLCTICHSWQHTGVVHLSLQADGSVAFEDVPVFGVWRPACHDSSLYLFVLVPFLEVVVLGVLSTTITFVFAMFILRPICLLSSDSSCSICCSSCGVSVHRNMYELLNFVYRYNTKARNFLV